ncbi:MAG: LamG domain-containing protein, partial [Planctomycetota bacterium]
AIGTYPWNWAPVVHQSEWRERGYYLGIDKSGHLGLKVSVGGKWEEVTSSKTVGLNRWTHVAGTFDKASGKICVYIDGEEVGSRSVAKEQISVADTEVIIGRNSKKLRPTDPVRRYATLPTLYGFDGLIDEVMIYSKALSSSEISESYERSKPSDLLRDEPAMKERQLPSGPTDVGRFGAYYTKLNYYETWDNLWRVSEHPDVVVKFDEMPVSVVFWRGTSYGPGWVTENNKWISDQSVEEGADEIVGCGEHMSDKQCRHSHVRIIENTDARVVVHWRYAVVDILYQKPRLDSKTGWSDWVDEYYTIYPDGVGIRNVKYWSSDYGHYCFQDTQFLSGPGTRPEDNIELEALTVLNSRGESRTLSWAERVPKNTLRDANIEMVNLKSEYKPFLIFEEGVYIKPWGQSEKNDYCPWPTWNHWPVSQILSDGRLATADDRLRHSALGGVDIDDVDKDMAIYGLTNKPASSLVALANSWNHAPSLKVMGAGFKSEGYDRGQRAYVLRQTLKGAKLFRLALEGSTESPIVNPCFVVKNWAGDATVELGIEGTERKVGRDFRQGIVRDTDGPNTTFGWTANGAYVKNSPNREYVGCEWLNNRDIIVL